jgi:hypothetical protein
VDGGWWISKISILCVLAMTGRGTSWESWRGWEYDTRDDLGWCRSERGALRLGSLDT